MQGDGALRQLCGGPVSPEIVAMSDGPMIDVVRRIRRAAGHGPDDRADAELLQAFLARAEEDAFTAIVTRYSGLVLGVCRRVLGNTHDAEDATQAVFLILARQASHLRRAESLPGWLHGTARRIALQAKREAGRRRKRERRVRHRDAVDPAAELMWREVQAVLDSEIQRLPHSQRSAFVLCCLEGLSHAAAGKRLRIAEGSVSSRITRARQRLHTQLQKRGVALSALQAALAASSVAPAALTPSAQAVLVRFVCTRTAGRPMSVPGLSPKVVEFAGAASHNAWTASIRILALGLVAASVLGASVYPVLHWPTAVKAGAVGQTPSPAMPGRPRTQSAGSSDPKVKLKQLTGRVLDPDGKALPGAKLLLLGQPELFADMGTAGPDGRFAAQLPTEPPARCWLVAEASGMGIDFIEIGRLKPGEPVELRLVRDQVVRGRIVDTQGKPVPGARVGICHLGLYAGRSLDPFLAEWKARPPDAWLPEAEKQLWSEEGSLLATTADAEGRFAVAGAGAERLAGLRVGGDGVADAEVWVVNRAGFDPRPANEATRTKLPRAGRPDFGFHPLLYGPELTIVVETERPIRGVATEADSGKPCLGVEVRLERYGHELARVPLKGKTDARGRYTIRGARKAESYEISVLGNPDTGFLAYQSQVPDTAGYQPVVADIRLVRGVILTGKVIDKATGRPVPAFIRSMVLADNRFVKNYPRYDPRDDNYMKLTATDGTFRVVTIPGPVLLAGGPDCPRLPQGCLDGLKYKPLVPDPRYPQYFRKQALSWGAQVFGGGWVFINGNACRVLQIETGTRLVKQDLVLEQFDALPVKIEGPAGRPLSGTWVVGINPANRPFPVHIAKDCCPAYGVEPGRPRRMLFYEPTKQLFGALTLTGDEKGLAVARLAPGGELKGRLVDEAGKPLAGISLGVEFVDEYAEYLHRNVHRAKQTVTLANGVFAFNELIPGQALKLKRLDRGPATYGAAGRLNKSVKLKPAETLDLGDIRVRTAPGENEGK
jgi:RNA polymerase sigma factor (sigma-70 family)